MSLIIDLENYFKKNNVGYNTGLFIAFVALIRWLGGSIGVEAWEEEVDAEVGHEDCGEGDGEIEAEKAGFLQAWKYRAVEGDGVDDECY